MSAGGGRGPAAELVLAASFLAPRPERLAALARAAARPAAWDGALRALELHGVLPLAARNLALARVAPPPAVRAELEARVARLAEDARRDRTTLRRFLAAANARGVEPLLLKGASLAVDAYPEPGLRSQGDVDLLVRPSELGAAVRAGADVGLVPGAEQLPAWWYRLAHFHLKLHPSLALLREVELHWCLEPPASLVTPDLAGLRARATLVELPAGPRGPGGPGETSGAPSGDPRLRAWNPDPIDRLVHLAAHLARHAGRVPGAIGVVGEVAARDGRDALLDVLAHDVPALRLKWVLDVAVEVERLHATRAPGELAARALEWCAEAQLRGALALARALGAGAEPAAARWIERVLELLPAPSSHAGGPSRAAAEARGAHGARPLPVLDVRWRSLGGLLRWAFPPRAWLERRRRRGTAPPLPLARALHAGTVLGRSAAALATLPAALLHRSLLAPARRSARRRALEPERVLDLVGAARRPGR